MNQFHLLITNRGTASRKISCAMLSIFGDDTLARLPKASLFVTATTTLALVGDTYFPSWGVDSLFSSFFSRAVLPLNIASTVECL
jgi:hypothetical protein